jgi:GTP-dependent phosphoenolpyruvate carboxykinase
MRDNKRILTIVCVPNSLFSLNSNDSKLFINPRSDVPREDNRTFLSSKKETESVDKMDFLLSLFSGKNMNF